MIHWLNAFFRREPRNSDLVPVHYDLDRPGSALSEQGASSRKSRNPAGSDCLYIAGATPSGLDLTTGNKRLTIRAINRGEFPILVMPHVDTSCAPDRVRASVRPYCKTVAPYSSVPLTLTLETDPLQREAIFHVVLNFVSFATLEEVANVRIPARVRPSGWKLEAEPWRALSCASRRDRRVHIENISDRIVFVSHLVKLLPSGETRALGDRFFLPQSYQTLILAPHERDPDAVSIVPTSVEGTPLLPFEIVVRRPSSKVPTSLP